MALPSPTRRRIAACCLVAGLAGALAALPGAAQDYPTHPVRIVVPFAAGGPADVYARVLAQHLQETLGQTFIVEDKPGAGSIIGTDAVAKAAPDGYTLLLMSNTHTVNESLIPTKPFQLMRDFVPVAPINSSDLVLVGKAGLQASTLRELIAYAKSHPGALSYASSGPGTPYHMAGELFKAMAGVSIVHIPYRGSSGARSDVLGGQVDMMFDAIPTMADHIRSGKVKALRHHRQDALAGAARRADRRRGRRAGLRGGDLARHDGAQGHAAGDRAAAQRRDRQDRRPARRREGLGGAGRHADDDGRRRVRALPRAGHHQVGAHRQDLGREARPMTAGPVLRLLCAGAARGLVDALQARFAAETGARIEGRFGAVGAMKEALAAGAPCDVMVVTDAMVTALADSGALDGSTRAPLGVVRTGVAVRAGDAAPAIDTPDALRAALLGADRICFPDPARATAGIHFASVLQRLGVDETLAPRLATFPNGATAMAALAAPASAARSAARRSRRSWRRPACAWWGAARGVRARDGLHRRGGAARPRSGHWRSVSSSG